MSEAFDATAVADAVAEAVGTATAAAATATATVTTATTIPIDKDTDAETDTDTDTATTTATTTTPRALPTGWLLKESRSHPGCFYYYFIPTGLASWHAPVQAQPSQMPQPEQESDALPLSLSLSTTGTSTALPGSQVSQVSQTTQSTERSQSHPSSSMAINPQQQQLEPKDETTTGTTCTNPTTVVAESTGTPGPDPDEEHDRATKRRKTAGPPPPSSSSAAPKEVRVLHILKKHKDSRRPSSWRQAKITSTLEEAKSELESLLEILLEEQGNFHELKATFEELARTESDCSSAKRGGDLGFFGRRKMQPPFEEASFALKIGELTQQVVETSSGVHLILRIG